MGTKLKSPELSKVTAAAFADKWKSYTDEKQYARGFWSDFFVTLCGVDDQEEAGIEYEKRVKSTISGNQEYIDVYWKNVALIEHKSAGENLDKAELQARGYWLNLSPGYRPKTIIISDFHNFRIVDVALNKVHEFPLSKLPDNIHRFEAIISGNRTKISDEEITVDQQAAKLMANLYLELESHGFEGHETSIFLVRLLFLLFGDDTGMWSKNLFLKLVMDTQEDGSDVGSTFDNLFEALNTAPEKRTKNLSPGIRDFPYVNGNIFAEKIAVIDFNKKMRKALVEVANYDWTTINPTIFGSLFQLIKNKEARRELGEHYTSEENINKIIYPLFLDQLQEKLASAWDSTKELKKLRQELAKVKIFDPACGCGNFLVVSYRHLRQLELELIVRLNNLEGSNESIQIDGSIGLSITLNQFYGFEIEEWPAKVAQMALFLTEHQENLKLERVTGEVPKRFPITKSANIFNLNALRTDWGEYIHADESTYILGNPPFAGSRLLTDSQRQDQALIWNEIPGSGVLDFVSNWFVLAAKMISISNSSAAFIATNSITQGNQPNTIWTELDKYGVEIFFAHRSFVWDNEATGKAAVHCVIIGISRHNQYDRKIIWTYENKNEPKSIVAKNINAYLLNSKNILIAARTKPLSIFTPRMEYGNVPRDGGFISDISPLEASEIKLKDPIAAKYLRFLVGSEELLNGPETRYCLWLLEATPNEIHASKVLKHRVDQVREERKKSTGPKGAAVDKPSLFASINQPSSRFLAVPSVSSSRRDYIPIAFLSPNVIVNNRVFIINSDNLALFGIMESFVFTTWVRAISSRLKSDYMIAASTVYNTFPFIALREKVEIEVIDLVKELLEIRDSYKSNTLAELYDPISMPPNLRMVHKKLDSVVFRAFNIPKDAPEDQVLESLFEIYLQQVSEAVD
jgi:type I restriction-modification system DNA methylase subunit